MLVWSVVSLVTSAITVGSFLVDTSRFGCVLCIIKHGWPIHLILTKLWFFLFFICSEQSSYNQIGQRVLNYLLLVYLIYLSIWLIYNLRKNIFSLAQCMLPLLAIYHLLGYHKFGLHSIYFVYTRIGLVCWIHQQIETLWQTGKYETREYEHMILLCRSSI